MCEGGKESVIIVLSVTTFFLLIISLGIWTSSVDDTSMLEAQWTLLEPYIVEDCGDTVVVDSDIYTMEEALEYNMLLEKTHRRAANPVLGYVSDNVSEELKYIRIGGIEG